MARQNVCGTPRICLRVGISFFIDQVTTVKLCYFQINEHMATMVFMLTQIGVPVLLHNLLFITFTPVHFMCT